MNKKFGVDIFHETIIKKEAKTVFKLISTSEGWDSWFTDGTIFDPLAEKSFFIWRDWGPDKVNEKSRIKILELVEPKLVRFLWNFELEGGATEVKLSLKEVDDGTLLSVRESGYEDSKEGREAIVNCSTGWGEAITLIKIYAEHKISYN